MAERRKYTRVNVVGISADIARDNYLFLGCDVGDVSEHGLLISNVRSTLAKKDIPKECELVVTIKDRPIRVSGCIKWFNKNPLSNNVDVGFEITNNLRNWLSRIDHLIPDKPKDVWCIQGEKYLR